MKFVRHSITDWLKEHSVTGPLRLSNSFQITSLPETSLGCFSKNLKQNVRSRTEEQNHHRAKKKKEMTRSQKPRIRTLVGSLDKQGVSQKQNKAVNREFSLQDNRRAHYDTTRKWFPAKTDRLRSAAHLDQLTSCQ